MEAHMISTGNPGIRNKSPILQMSMHSYTHFWLLPTLVSLIIFSASFHEMTLFHTLAELASIAIALTMFVMVWYSYRYNRNHFLLFIGIGYGWIAGIDLAHTLTYKGIDLFSDDPNRATQLWVIARYFQAVLLLAAPIFLVRKVSRRKLNAVFSGLAVLSIIWVASGTFPTAYIEGQGLTPFKIVSEYIIIAILLAALVVAYSCRTFMDWGQVILLGLSIMLMVAAEYTFTLYVQVDEIPIIVGHLLKLFSHWLLFIIIAQTMFVGPSRSLARNAAIFESLPMPTVVVVEDGVISDGNQLARRSERVLDGNILGRDCHDIFHPRSLSRNDCSVCEAIANRTTITDYSMLDETDDTWTSFTLAPVDEESPSSGMVHICRDISLRKSLELQARETRTSFETIVEMAPESIISINTEQKVILFNKSAEKTFGYARDEIIGETIDVLIPEMSVERHRTYVEKFLASGQHSAIMRAGIGIFGRRKSGKLFMAEAAITRQDRKQGSILTVILRDTTEQKNRERKLRNSEERFRTLSELASDWVWESDADHKFSYISHQFNLPVWAVTEPIIGKSRKEFAKPDPADANWQRHFDDMDNHREFRDFQYSITVEDGSEVYFSISGSPQYDDDGGFTGYIGIGRDLTAKKQDLIESERQRSLLETIISGIPNSLIFTNAKREIIAANPGFERMFGYTQEEALGQSTKFLFADPALYEEFGENHLNSDMPMEETEYFINYRRNSGEPFLGKLVGAPVRDGQNNVQGFVALIDDISDQVMTELQLRQSQKMEAVGQLTGGIAHDFNNLLTIIIGNLRLLEDEQLILDDANLRELLSDTFSAAMDGAELTSRLLAYSRESPLKPGNQHLDSLVENMIALASRTLRADVDVSYENAGLDVGLFVDEQQFDGALLNLLLNAQDAMPDGGEILVTSGDLVVSEDNIDKYPALTPGKYVIVRIADSGTGMPKEVLEHACEPFYTTKIQGHGTGLGLSTVLGFARQSGGDFRLTSHFGEGTTAKMYFPYVQMRAALDDSRDKDLNHKTKASPIPDSLTILVTEDDDDVRKVISSILESAGHSVLQASSGEEAKRVVAGHTGVDVLVSDVIMPGGINGYELADWMHQTHPDIRIQIVTGYDNIDKNGKGVVRGDYPVLRKPFTPEKLIDALTDLFSD